jgi:hypothetical protein
MLVDLWVIRYRYCALFVAFLVSVVSVPAKAWTLYVELEPGPPVDYVAPYPFVEFIVESKQPGVWTTLFTTKPLRLTQSEHWEINDLIGNVSLCFGTINGSVHMILRVDHTIVFDGICVGRTPNTNEGTFEELAIELKVYKTSGYGPCLEGHGMFTDVFFNPPPISK